MPWNVAFRTLTYDLD